MGLDSLNQYKVEIQMVFTATRPGPVHFFHRNLISIQEGCYTTSLEFPAALI